MREELRDLVRDKPIAIRIEARALTTVLTEGEYRCRSRPAGPRDLAEREWFGTDAAYGYVAVDGIQPSGFRGDDDVGGTDMLSRWGAEQIVLKPEVRSRTTFTVGDSLAYKYCSVPSPLNDPREWSYGACTDAAFDGIRRNYSGHPFRSEAFVEAQIHGGITLADIDYVVLHREPNSQLAAALDRSGVEWRVLNNTTIAEHGNPAERAAALERAHGDLLLLTRAAIDSGGAHMADPVFRDMHRKLVRDVERVRTSLSL